MWGFHTGESQRGCETFYFPSTSKANCPNVIIQIKHPVNCTQPAGFFLYPTLHLHCHHRLPQCLGFLTRGAKIYQSRLHSLWSAGAGGVACSTRHNTWPFVKHSHYRQRKKVWATSAYIEAHHATQRGNLSSPCVGTAVIEISCDE